MTSESGLPPSPEPVPAAAFTVKIAVIDYLDASPGSAASLRSPLP
jgi:hypothetical protein